MAQITTEGDVGDVVYLLNIIKQIPNGPHELLVEQKSAYTATGKLDGAEKLEDFIHDLVVEQPYISDCRMLRPGDNPLWRSGGFRGAGLHRRTETLMNAHLTHLNQVTGMGLKIRTDEPWITLKEEPEKHNSVVVNRTKRYNNNRFPWKEIVDYYSGRMTFVGLPHEHAQFQMEFGTVGYRPTATLKEVAQIIKGSQLFIGNQSCCFALAEGMKHPSIQETSLHIPDCIYKRDNVQHVWDGDCNLPSLDGGPVHLVRSKTMNIGLVSPMKTPPNGGWKYPGVSDCETFYQCCDLVSQLPSMRGVSMLEIENAIKQVALDRVPNYYRPTLDGDNVRQALYFAGYH